MDFVHNILKMDLLEIFYFLYRQQFIQKKTEDANNNFLVQGNEPTDDINDKVDEL